MAPPSREYLYGINPSFEVIRAGRRKIYEAFVNEATIQQPRLAKLVAFMGQRSIPVTPVDKHRLFELSRSKEHQGVVLKTNPYPYALFEEMRGAPRLLLLDNVEDPTNVGAIIRSAELFGFQDICLPVRGTPDIYPSVIKVSAGAAEYARICRNRTANQYLKAALDDDYLVVALDGKGTTSLTDVFLPADKKLFLVIGGEDKSVGQFILNSAHYVARIPMCGRINSLNASVAAGIAMYHLSTLIGSPAP